MNKEVLKRAAANQTLVLYNSRQHRETSTRTVVPSAIARLPNSPPHIFQFYVMILVIKNWLDSEYLNIRNGKTVILHPDEPGTSQRALRPTLQKLRGNILQLGQISISTFQCLQLNNWLISSRMTSKARSLTH